MRWLLRFVAAAIVIVGVVAFALSLGVLVLELVARLVVIY